MRMIVVLLAALLAAPLAANAQSMPALLTHGIVVANMDRAVKPGDDFYRYANGDWLKRTEIPSNRSYIDPYGGDLDFSSNDLTRKRIAGVIEEAAKANAPAGSKTRKIADFYHSYMDEAAIEAKGLAPLRPHLDAIAAIRDKHELARALGESLRADVDALNIDSFHTANLFGLWVGPALTTPSTTPPTCCKVASKCPTANTTSPTVRACATSAANIRRTFPPCSSSRDYRQRIVRAAAHCRTGARHRRKTCSLGGSARHPKGEQHLEASRFRPNAPGSTGQSTFAAPALSEQASFIVWQPSAFTGESALVASTALDTWKDWLAFQLIEDYAGVLPKAFADEHFVFFGRPCPVQRNSVRAGSAASNS